MSLTATTNFEAYSIATDGTDRIINSTLDHVQRPSGVAAAVLADTYHDSALAKLWTSMICQGFLEAGIDPLTGHVEGYLLHQASWAAAVAKLLDGEVAIDELAETGASAGFAAVRISSAGSWEAYWAGGCRVAVFPEADVPLFRYCEDEQPFESPSLNSLLNTSLPLNSASGQLDQDGVVVMVDSNSSNWLAASLRDDGVWESEASLVGMVRKARHEGELSAAAINAILGRVTYHLF
ncbi:MAG: hypothetical protein HKN43_05320 [Rhodothermales bacterium]|nr:hypothetical protein [Rhodothermales bacterium]